MKYKLKYTDGRHQYHKWFFCYISFSKYMGEDRGPLNFCQALDWFTEKYGTTSEVRLWRDMKEWQDVSKRIIAASIPRNIAVEDIDKYVNPYWSWSNGLQDLRIYIHSEKELSFFRLSFS